MKIPFSKLSLALAAAGLLLLSGSRLFGAQGLSREVWTNIETPPEAQLVDYPAFLGLPLSLTGTPDFYTRADAIDVLGKAVSSAVYAGSSGIRMRGYLIAPDSGDYSFWVTCQDAVAVYMSIDTNPNGKRLIIAHNGPESGQTASSPLTSAPVRLEAGKKYYLEVIQKSEATNGTFVLSWNLPSGRSQVIPESAFETYTPPTTASPGLTREFFPNIPGSSLDEFTSNPAFYRVPAVTTEGSPSSQRGLGQDYGVRLRGYLTAPATGDYTFWECGSGDVSVLLATDDNPHAVHQPLQLNDRPSIRVIASHKGHTAPFEWAKYRDQQSKPVGLIAGRRYYLEILFKSGNEPDHVSIAWQAPGGQPEMIPRSVLESYRRDPSDLDDDGMPDVLERLYGLDPTDASDAFGDLDGDGIFNDEAIRAGADPRVRGSVDGIVTVDRWNNVPGDRLDPQSYRAAFTRPISVRTTAVSTRVHGGGSDFIQRIRGYITPPVSGTYTFWGAADNTFDFYLSTTGSKFDRQLLIKNKVLSRNGKFDLDLSQKSPPIRLVAGEKYYFELWHKQGFGNAYVSLAWKIPGEPRQQIAARFLSTYAGEANDRDDDYLSDDWELTNGLDPGDDGRRPGSKNGAFGDLDGDGLTNLQERMLGTRANATDSNGDGLSDFDEANFFQSARLAGDIGPFTTVATLSGDAYSASFGEWQKENSTALQRSRRGSVTYPVNVQTSGVHAIRFTLTSRVDGTRSDQYDFRVSINGCPVSYQTIRIPENGTSSLAILTPWLDSGKKNECELFVDNSYNWRRISVDKMEILAPGGSDFNGNHVPDWVDIRLRDGNGFDRTTFDSITSPAVVEGRTRYPSFLDTHGASVTVAPNGRFFTEVQLAADAAQTLQFDFENKAISEAVTVRWKPTNLVGDSDAITIRQGDTLLLTAFRSAVESEREAYTIVANGQTITGAGNQSIPVTFSSPGAQTIECTHTDAQGNVASRTREILVLPKVTIENPLCVTGSPRLWNYGALPAGAELVLDAAVQNWKETTANAYADIGIGPPSAENTTVILTSTPQDRPFLVRQAPYGLILGSGAVKSVSVRSNDLTGGILEIQGEPVSTVRLPVVISGDLSGAEIRCKIVIGGVTFLDGTTTNSLWSADFDNNGVSSLMFLMANGAHSNCRFFSVWKDGICLSTFDY